MSERKLVYLAAPYSGDVQFNIARIKHEARKIALENQIAPIIPHLMYPEILDDDNEYERALGINMDLDLICACDELWYFGDNITKGMAAEIEYAKVKNIPVYQKNWSTDAPRKINFSSVTKLNRM